MSGQRSNTSDFQSLTVRGLDAERAERLLAEAREAGAVGAEQRDGPEGIALILYAPRSRVVAVGAVCRALGAGCLEPPAEIPAVEWSEAWKEGLCAVEISPRLRVRPPFDRTRARAGQRDLVIEPGQAFGTGAHESTRLALTCLDVLDSRLEGRRILDVGVGSGVLALAALALGAREAVGFDLDPLAVEAAHANAAENGLGAGLRLFAGPLDAVSEKARFDGALANLLRSELEPLLPGIASRIQTGGWLVIAGLLAEEWPGVEEQTRACGLRLEDRRGERDASGVEWIGALMRVGPTRGVR